MPQTLISEEVAKTPPEPGAVGIYSVPLQLFRCLICSLAGLAAFL